MSGRFADQNILVTGANSGIGLAAAQRFVDEGGRVFITGRDQDRLDAAVRQLGHGTVGIGGDLTDPADLDSLFATVRRHVDRLDAVVANAGAGSYAPMGTMTEKQFDERFAINTKAVAFSVQGALPLIPEGGAVVLVGSISAGLGLPGLGVYAASKAALRSFARSWTSDLKDRRIRVNTVSPGHVYTHAQVREGVSRESYDSIVPTIPLGRLGTAEEMAAAIAFMASRDASYITGTELIVDGGLTQV